MSSCRRSSRPSTLATMTMPRTLLVSSMPSSARRSATRAYASTMVSPAAEPSSSTFARSTPGRMAPSAGGVTRPPPRTRNRLDVAPSNMRPSSSTRMASSTPAAVAAALRQVRLHHRHRLELGADAHARVGDDAERPRGELALVGLDEEVGSAAGRAGRDQHAAGAVGDPGGLRDGRDLGGHLHATRGALQAERLEAAVQARHVLLEEDRHPCHQLERLVQAQAVSEGAVGDRQYRLLDGQHAAVEHHERHGGSLQLRACRAPSPFWSSLHAPARLTVGRRAVRLRRTARRSCYVRRRPKSPSASAG